MTADKSQVIVTNGTRSCCSMPITKVHHRDFPEVRAEGKTVAEGTERLANQLARERTNIGGGWRRDLVDRAIADLNAFLEDLEPSERPQVVFSPGSTLPGSLPSS